MLMMLGKDVVEIRAPDGSWQRPGTAQLKPENVLEYLLDAIDMGVFMPDSDMRPVVRSLFGTPPAGTVADPLEAVFDHRIEVHALQGQWVALPRINPLKGSQHAD